MSLYQNIVFLVIGLPVALLAAGAAIYFWKKSLVTTNVQIQCSSGDSEVMSFTYNFTEDEAEESKASKLEEAFARIDERRRFNHERFLKIKEEAIEENLAKNQGNSRIHTLETEGSSRQRTAN